MAGRWFVVPILALLLAAALTPASELSPNQTDIVLYFQTAGAIANGGLPYLNVQTEYPPLALVPMLVPYLAWLPGNPPLDAFLWLFVGWECALLAGLVFVVVRIGERFGLAGDSVAQSLAVLAVAMAPPLAFRFDLFPTLLAAAAVLAALSGRAGPAGILLGLGVLAKLFPAVLAPALAIPWLLQRDWVRLGRFAFGLAGTVALGWLPFVAAAGPDAWSAITYQLERGLQIESLGGGLVLLGGWWTGQPIQLLFEFGAVHVSGDGAEAILALLPWLSVLGFGLLTVLAIWRMLAAEPADPAERGRLIVDLALAYLLVLLLTNKVFSVQYVVWLLPFAALVSGGRFWLMLAIAILSVAIHPVSYEHVIGQDTYGVLLLNARNALVVALLAWQVREVARPARLELTAFRSAT